MTITQRPVAKKIKNSGNFSNNILKIIKNYKYMLTTIKQSNLAKLKDSKNKFEKKINREN
jgi:hypothetical protein